MKNTENDIVVVDVGNGHTCWMTSEKSGSFPSVVKHVTQAEQKTLGGGIELFHYHGKGSFYVGLQAVIDGAQPRVTDTEFYTSDDFMICLEYALTLAGVPNPTLVVGLPVHWHAKFENKVRSNIKRALGNREHLKPSKIVVLSQHSAAFFDPKLRDGAGETVASSKKLEGEVGVIDFGQGTIDAAKFVQGHLTTTTFGNDKGVQVLHSKILAELTLAGNDGKRRRRLGLPRDFSISGSTNESDIDQWLRRGVIPFGKERINSQDVTREMCRDYASEQVALCVKQMWGQSTHLDAIIFAGGGAALLGREILSECVDCDIWMSEDPSMAIANGFMVLAKMAKKQSAA